MLVAFATEMTKAILNVRMANNKEIYASMTRMMLPVLSHNKMKEMQLKNK